MKILNHLFFCIVLLVSSTACIRDAKNVKVTPENPRLVVTCFISPNDTVIKAKVSKSVPLLGRIETNYNGNFISNAQVSISDGEKSIQLEYNTGNLSYLASTQSFKIEAGKTYFIEVSTPEGLKVTSSTIVPVQRVAEADIFVSSEPVNESISRIYTVLFNDFPNQQNYYRIEGYYSTSFSWDNKFFNNTVFWEEDKGYNLYTDVNNEGQQIKSLKAQIYSDTSVTFMVHHLSRDYYLFHESLQNFEGDNPFSEPVLIYSNIKDGLGVFAGYHSTTVKVE